MPKLTVLNNEIAREVPFAPGPCLRELLEAAGIWVRSGCRANGACGLCLIEIEGENVPAPTGNERLHLSLEQLARNTRLACQVVPDADLRIRIVNPSEKSAWRDLDAALVACTPPHLPPFPAAQFARSTYGLAVDLGTTHISVSLWDLKHGERLAGRVGRNPQSYFGSDVLTRLIAARESGENAARIARIAVEAIREAFLDICSRKGLNPAAVRRIAVVGNTSMLALLTATDPAVLLWPGSWARPIECRQADARSWVPLLGIDPQATIEIVAPCGGFVGSDLLASVLATRLTSQPGSLLVDFGTNSEMALWDGDRLWVTSAAGGPAFDGYHVRCGMPAEPGAIYGVDRPDCDGKLRYAVIGGGKARGVCGSGLVDLIACLRDGRFDRHRPLCSQGRGELRHPRGGFHATPVGCGRGHVSASERSNRRRHQDAVGGGEDQGGRAAGSLRRRGLWPAFELPSCPGRRPAAQRCADQVVVCGNTALAGCERILLRPRALRTWRRCAAARP